MKREAVVCDLEADNWGAGHCQRLADYVCPLCSRDVCREHRATKLSVLVQLVWPKRPQNNGAPPRDEVAGVHEVMIDVCVACFKDTSPTAPSLKTVAGEAAAKAVEAYGADLAARRLQKKDD